MPKTFEIDSGQRVIPKRDAYTGLWNVWYVEGHSPKWAGPFKTKREAIAAIERHLEK